MNPLWIGSELIVSNQNIQKITSGLVNRTSDIINDSDDYVEIHNAFTAYTVLLLFASTGHRPVIDPFCYRADYSLQLGMMTIEDKVVSERHKHRLVALPEIAIQQLTNYEKHLKWLASKLIVDPISRDLEYAVNQILNTGITREEQALPLFFFLQKTKNSIKTLSISEALLSNYWDNAWPLPYNFSRHNIATQLKFMRNSGEAPDLSIESIEAHLGHLEGIKHPFGKSSVLAPLDYNKQISGPLNNLMIRQNWHPLATKKQFRNLDHLPFTQWKHSSLPLGPVARKIQRQARKENDNTIIKQALDKYSAQDLIQDKSAINNIRQEIIRKSENDKDRINTRLMLLWKKLITLKSTHPDFKLPRRLHIIDNEASPFDKDSIGSYIDANNLRLSFIRYLEAQGKEFSKTIIKDIKYYLRVSEILVSAALFDHITNKEILEEISLSGLPLTCEADITYMDITRTDNSGKKYLLWRWLPQPLSIALLNGIDSGNVSNPRMTYFNQERFLHELVKLLSHLGVNNVRQNNAYAKLADLAQSFWLMHTPSFLREIAIGNIPVQPVAETTLVRILRQERLLNELDKQEVNNKNNITVLSYALLTQNASHQTSNGKAFLSKLNSLINKSQKLKGKSRISASYVRKMSLGKMLNEVLSEQHNYPSVCVALGSWGIKLCKEGTDLYGSIAFSTVKTYLKMIANALVETTSKNNFFNLDPDQYDYIYDVAIEINKHEDQTRLLNNLKDFHHFLMSAGLAPPIDWGNMTQSVYTNRQVARVDANIITSTEYLKALKLIFDAGESGNLDKRISMQYCALLIFGYHFGLRISEAYHLQFRHIQHNKDWTRIVVHVRNTLFADTKSTAGIRQIPLTDNLNSLERSIINTVCDLHVTTHNDEQAFLFSSRNETRELINKTQASQILNNVLKQVTGDPDCHYHLLRHSFNSRKYPQFFDINDSALDNYMDKLSSGYRIENNNLRKLLTGRDKISSKALSALSVATGHSQISTTLSNYIHTSDHHLYHIASNEDLWSNFDFTTADYITSYAHLLAYETVKKRRVRNNVNTRNLLDSLYATTKHVSIPTSDIKTTSHPEKELLSMNTRSTDSNDISLIDIDKILLLYCTLPDNNNETIAERLYLDTNTTVKVIQCFKEQKLSLGYTGYNLNSASDKHTLGKTERPSETIALHKLLPSIQNKLELLNNSETSTLVLGINIWTKAYYPNKRYRPLVFTNPHDVINFINGMQIIDIEVTDMAATVPEHIGKWYKADPNTSTLVIVTDDKLVKYKFNYLSQAKNIPLPLSRERITNKERISLSVDKNSKPFIAYQKRFHRLLFLMAIYMKFKNITQ